MSEKKGNQKQNGQNSVPFADPINVSISVRPYIETYDIDYYPGYHMAEHFLRFVVKVDKEYINEAFTVALSCVAAGRYYGEQSGPEWEAAKAYWQKQYDYLAKHLPGAVARATIYAQSEAIISHNPEWDLDSIVADADFEELSEWASRHTKAKYDSGAMDMDDDFRLSPHQIVRQFARAIWWRLQGKLEPESPSTSPIGQFTAKDHQKVIDSYPNYVKKWKAIRAIINSEPESEWLDSIKALDRNPAMYRGIPMDLFNAIREKIPSKTPPRRKVPKYRPWQVALVDAARSSRVLNKDGSRLGMEQVDSIRRAINSYSDATGKPRLSIQDESEKTVAGKARSSH